MPQPKLTVEQMLESVNLVEQYGSAHMAARNSSLPKGTIEWRCQQGRLNGVKPTIYKETPKPYVQERLGRVHLVIPDLQVHSGVNTDHLEQIGNYIVEKKPDVIIQLGDAADIPSLNSYTKGKREAEGKRLMKDIAAVHLAMERLFKPIHDYNRTAEVKYEPEWELTEGNHEHRIEREIEDNPRLEGMFDKKDLAYEEFGWRVHEFLKVLTIDGVEYAHYFTSGNMGRPVTTAAALLRERQCSAIMGHVQHTDMAFHKKTQNIAMFAGICYTHDEAYLGPQGNNTRRQIVMLHEVEDGRFDPMFVSLKFLSKRYA